MRIGLIFPSFVGEEPDCRFHVERAQQAEELGFDSVFAGDHLFGHSPTPDPLAMLAAMAAATSRITLGTGVLLLALREPAVVAKQVATIDSLCRGRFVLGVGLGGEMEAEWEAMEIPLRRRGARLDEYLILLRELWSGKPVDHAGEFRTIRGVTGSPAPTHLGGPPIWIGGRSDAAVRRALVHDGWCAYATSPRTLAKRVSELRRIRGGDFVVSAMVFTRLEPSNDAALDGANEVISAMYRQDFRGLLQSVGAVGDAAHVASRLGDFAATGIDHVILCPVVPAALLELQLRTLAAVLFVA